MTYLCCLTYGDARLPNGEFLFHRWARSVLPFLRKKPRPWPFERIEVVIGVNESLELEHSLLGADGPLTRELAAEADGLTIISSPFNICKYPMMRAMFNQAGFGWRQGSVSGKSSDAAVMWFDDDSCFLPQADPGTWWDELAAVYNAQPKPMLIGRTYSMPQPWSAHHLAFLSTQPWFSPAAVQDPARRPTFVTGGWWVAREALLAELQYPFAFLRHNGGDVVLGEALRHLGHKPTEWFQGIAINSHDGLTHASAQPRGESMARPYSFWAKHAAPWTIRQPFTTSFRVTTGTAKAVFSDNVLRTV